MTLRIPYSSQIQEEKVKVGGDEDDANDNDLKLLSDFFKECNEDILLEIFVRLPYCRSAIQCGYVCRYWHYLISSPQFISRFISHHREHQDCYPVPLTIIFRRADSCGLGLGCYHYYRPLCKLFSNGSMFLHGKSAISTSYLDFLHCPMVIRASCNDLLLAYPGGRQGLGKKRSASDDIYICNPITKQYYRLPEFSRPIYFNTVIGHALVCIPTENGLSKNHFKVVEFYDIYPNNYNSEETISVVTSVFCSKSGKWSREIFQHPRPNGITYYCPPKEMEEIIVTCNGILYWLENLGNVDRVIKLDLSTMECGVIVFPDDFWWFLRPEDADVGNEYGRISRFWRFRRYHDYLVREQIGAVRGELRLLQVVLTCAELFLNLKIWKMNDYDKEWVLIHDKKNLETPSGHDDAQFTAAFVHPTNDDVVLLVWDEYVFQYNLIKEEEEEDTYEMMGELEDFLDIEYSIEQAEGFGSNERLLSFHMLHPHWPTQLPIEASNLKPIDNKCSDLSCINKDFLSYV